MSELNKIDKFVIFCLELYRTNQNEHQRKVLSDFKKHHVFDFLREGFDVLHTQSPRYIYKEIESFINHKK